MLYTTTVIAIALITNPTMDGALLESLEIPMIPKTNPAGAKIIPRTNHDRTPHTIERTP